MPTNPGDVTYEIDPAESDAASFGQVLGARGDVNYEESGSLPLIEDVTDLEIDFIWQKETADYRFEYLYVEDSNGQPEDIRAVVNERTTTGFTLKLSAAPDTSLSTLRWKITTPDGLHLTQPPTSQPRYVVAGLYQPIDSDLTAISALTTTAFGRGFLTLASNATARSYIGAQTANATLSLWAATEPTALGLQFVQAASPAVTGYAKISDENVIEYLTPAQVKTDIGVTEPTALGLVLMQAASPPATSYVKITNANVIQYLTPTQVRTELGAIQGVTVTGNNGISVAGSGTAAITLGLGVITPTSISMASGNILMGATGGTWLMATSETVQNGLYLGASNVATVGAQKFSPATLWHGSGWKTNVTAAAQNVDFRAYTVPVQGVSNPSGYFLLESSVNNGTFGGGLRLYTSGGLTLGTTDPGNSNMSIPGLFSALALDITGAVVADTVVTGEITGTSLTLSSHASIGGGTQIQKVLSGIVVVTYSGCLAQNTSDFAAVFTGAALGDTVIVNPPPAMAFGSSCYTAWVSATNQVSIRISNFSSADFGAMGPGNFRVTLLKF